MADGRPWSRPQSDHLAGVVEIHAVGAYQHANHRGPRNPSGACGRVERYALDRLVDAQVDADLGIGIRTLPADRGGLCPEVILRIQPVGQLRGVARFGAVGVVGGRAERIRAGQRNVLAQQRIGAAIDLHLVDENGGAFHLESHVSTVRGQLVDDPIAMGGIDAAGGRAGVDGHQVDDRRSS